MDITSRFVEIVQSRGSHRSAAVSSAAAAKADEKNPISFFSDLLEGPSPEKQLALLQKLHRSSANIVEALRLVDAFLRQNWIPYLKSDADLSESHREKIEQEISSNLSSIKADLEAYEQEFTEASMRNGQVNEHAKTAVLFVTAQFKLIEASFKHMKRLRMQAHVNELSHEYFHLVPKKTWTNSRFRKRRNSAKEESLPEEPEPSPSELDSAKSSGLLPPSSLRRRGDPKFIGTPAIPDAASRSPPSSDPLLDEFRNDASVSSTALFESERQELINENETLRSQLHSLDDQLREVESQLHSIGDATSFMAATVEQQAEQLSHIFDLTGEALGSISRGTKNLNIAKATTSDLRLFTLVLLIFLSFSLLFLHYFY